MNLIAWLLKIFDELLPWEDATSRDTLLSDIRNKWEAIGESHLLYNFKKATLSSWGQILMLATVIPFQLWMRDFYYGQLGDDTDIDEL